MLGESESCSVVSTLCDPMDYTVHVILQVRMLEWVACPFSSDLLDPGIEPGSPALQADSLPAEPHGKPHHVQTSSEMLEETYFPLEYLGLPLLQRQPPQLSQPSLPAFRGHTPCLTHFSTTCFTCF